MGGISSSQSAEIKQSQADIALIQNNLTSITASIGTLSSNVVGNDRLLVDYYKKDDINKYFTGNTNSEIVPGPYTPLSSFNTLSTSVASATSTFAASLASATAAASSAAASASTAVSSVNSCIKSVPLNLSDYVNLPAGSTNNSSVSYTIGKHYTAYLDITVPFASVKNVNSNTSGFLVFNFNNLSLLTDVTYSATMYDNNNARVSEIKDIGIVKFYPTTFSFGNSSAVSMGTVRCIITVKGVLG